MQALLSLGVRRSANPSPNPNAGAPTLTLTLTLALTLTLTPNLTLTLTPTQERCVERGKATGRTDDTAEVIARRAKTFRNQSMPVVEALEGRGLLRRIDGSGDVEAVGALASAAFEPFAKS